MCPSSLIIITQKNISNLHCPAVAGLVLLFIFQRLKQKRPIQNGLDAQGEVYIKQNLVSSIKNSLIYEYLW